MSFGVFAAMRVIGSNKKIRRDVAGRLLRLDASAMIGVKEFPDCAVAYFTYTFDEPNWDGILNACTNGPRFKYGVDQLNRTTHPFSTVSIAETNDETENVNLEQ